ncbi:ABC transporter permease [Paenibacillus sp. 598K]|uniref:ABC transporter n=1 Tax=Paenibacillus sp. 598K TaxID=1117987 RepID=UPI000FF93265|nr:ABC transporter [Paenibacillus sp. 598K]GBF74727.1 ABC transporter permease [Paenibacillus sp. 598K]
MNERTAPPAIRLRDVVAAETTKIITHPASIYTLLLALMLNLAFAIIDAAGVMFSVHADQPPATLSDFGAVMFFPIYVFLVIPVIAASSEYKDGQFRLTLATVPNRKRLMYGKWIAMVMSILLAFLIAVLPARVILGMTDGLHAGSILADLGRWMVVYVLMSCIAYGLAGYWRNAIAPLAILVFIPVVIATGVLMQWPQLLRFLPDQAAMSVLGAPAYEMTRLPVPIALLALTGWAVVCLLAYGLALLRRDS